MATTLDVVSFITNSENGKTFSEIQRFVCELNGRDYDQKEIQPWSGKLVRVNRGYWCDNLLSSNIDSQGNIAKHGRMGILTKYCYKHNKRYYANDLAYQLVIPLEKTKMFKVGQIATNVTFKIPKDVRNKISEFFKKIIK